jgi:hypothetical protein
MVKRPDKLAISFIIMATILMVVLVFWSSQKTGKGVRESVSKAADTIPVDLTKSTKIDITSPDGKMTLLMETKKTSENNFNQTLFITTTENKAPLNIYSKDSSNKEFVSIPFNTFSPDNKFIFLKLEIPDELNYFVLRTDGKDINKDGHTIEIVKPFNAKYPGLKVTDVTGWGGRNLIVINTDTSEGKIGASYWFDLSNFSFIRLSTRFN